MPNENTIVARLTEAELFHRYLDSPVKVGATTSALVNDTGTMERTTARQKFAYDAECFPLESTDDLAHDLLTNIECNPDPLNLLEVTIRNLEILGNAFRNLRIDFERLAELTRVDDSQDVSEAGDRLPDWHTDRFLLAAETRGRASNASDLDISGLAQSLLEAFLKNRAASRA